MTSTLTSLDLEQHYASGARKVSREGYSLHKVTNTGQYNTVKMSGLG